MKGHAVFEKKHRPIQFGGEVKMTDNKPRQSENKAVADNIAGSSDKFLSLECRFLEQKRQAGPALYRKNANGKGKAYNK